MLREQRRHKADVRSMLQWKAWQADPSLTVFPTATTPVGGDVASVFDLHPLQPSSCNKNKRFGRSFFPSVDVLLFLVELGLFRLCLITLSLTSLQHSMYTTPDTQGLPKCI